MRIPFLVTALCLLISPLARADAITGASTGDVRVQQADFVRATELRRLEETLKLDQSLEGANLARARQLQSIESRRLEDRVRALEASQGVR